MWYIVRLEVLRLSNPHLFLLFVALLRCWIPRLPAFIWTAGNPPHLCWCVYSCNCPVNLGTERPACWTKIIAWRSSFLSCLIQDKTCRTQKCKLFKLVLLSLETGRPNIYVLQSMTPVTWAEKVWEGGLRIPELCDVVPQVLCTRVGLFVSW